ncbi:glycoside hydrolase family 85 protein [Sporormia fimetaria CBS 119925]|uniref:Glycoside hydrolase family 85 protein n=1 Tax=Sporormia fimetaria CBS 119925 TaxID=1340428 RepID=A0A6A6V384_9PLEO|nr:glycoside hydrolase family 85 protein [Sporormia fimetaria CBS 119925]
MDLPEGWKDVLRPIRNGFRDMFPSPDTGPTPEERAQQRALDRWKGFTYFDTFSELEEWNETDSDPLQRANTPLLRRTNRRFDGGEGTAKLAICHDYAGNYHDYEASQGAGVDEESYSCEYLQFVDCFIYFSHKLVCVPPPSWVNTLHRNGVKAIGTLLVERQTPGTEQLLHQIAGCFPVAEKLARLADHYGFDGWLMNIEKPFPKEQWDAQTLQSFLKQLKEMLGKERTLIWYDALTWENNVEYQNAFTDKNLVFSQACGALLTNYSWTEAKARSSWNLADGCFIPENVYFGIDVWAQNAGKLTRPRVTFPREGGGGTNSGIAVSELAKTGLSATLFGPAWSFEHFPGHGTIVERAVWDGCGLPEDLDCSCGSAKEYHPVNSALPITKTARRYAAGSDRFFYTDFRRAFQSHGSQAGSMLYDNAKLHSQLGAQSVLPHVTETTEQAWRSNLNVLSMRLEDNIMPSHRKHLGGPQLLVDVQSFSEWPDNARGCARHLPLFKVDMVADGTLRFQAVGYLADGMRNLSGWIDFYFKYTRGFSHRRILGTTTWGILRHVIQSDDQSSDDNRLLEFGLCFHGEYVKDVHNLFKLQWVRIVPDACLSAVLDCRIDNIRLERRCTLDKQHWRVCWDFHDTSEEMLKAEGQPYSAITGPFAFFSVKIAGVSARAYALEWVLSPKLEKMLISQRVDVGIVGFSFDGRVLADGSCQLRIDGEECVTGNSEEVTGQTQSSD